MYLHAANAVERVFRAVEHLSPKPEMMSWGDSIKFRFVIKNEYSALFLKLARLSSLLNTLLFIVRQGRVQEQGIIQRVIEETEEDINFLALAICGNGLTEKHNDFLTEFWKEDYADPNDPIGTRIPRAYTRRGIRPFINRAQEQENPHLADDAGRTIYEMYSGFLHGAAPHILELFDPESGRFEVDGMGMTSIHIDYIHDAGNSYYRGMLAAGMTVKAFGLAEILPSLLEDIQRFEAAIGIENLQKAPN